MTEVGSLYVRVRPNTAGFSSELESGVKSGFSRVAKLAAGAAAGFEIGKFVEGAVEGAAKVQKSQEAIREEFGQSGDKLVEFAHTSAASLGISAEASTALDARFGILLKNLGIGAPRAAEMTLNLQKLAGSLASIRGVDPTTIMGNLPQALAGNLRSLKQLGFAFSTTQLQAEAMNLGLVKSTVDLGKVKAAQESLAIAQFKATAAQKKYGDGSVEAASAVASVTRAQNSLTAAMKGHTVALDPATKAQAVYGLVTQNLGEYQKQAAANSGDLINVQRRLGAELSNADRTIGQALLPDVTKLAKYFADNLPAALEAAGKALRMVQSFVGAMWEKAKGPLEDFTKLIGGNKAVVLALLAAWGAYKAGMMAAMLATRIQAAVTAGTIRATLISTGIGALVVAASLAATAIITHWSTVKVWLQQFGAWIEANAKKLFFLPVIGPMILLTVEIVKHFQQIKAVVITVADALAPVFQHPVRAIEEMFTALWHKMETMAYDAVLKIIEPFSHLPFGMGKWAQQMKDELHSKLDAMKSDAADAGTAIGTGIGANMVAGLQPYIVEAGNALGGVLDKFQGVLGKVAAAAVNAGTVPAGGGPPIPTGGPSVAGDKLKAYIAQAARAAGLDPAAVLSIASVEGGFSGAVGDQGTSFGPFQLHKGGALPSGLADPAAWAQSAAGLQYAINAIANVAKGLTGTAAIAAIASRFERPADIPKEISAASSYYSQFAGTGTPPPSALPPPAATGTTPPPSYSGAAAASAAASAASKAKAAAAEAARTAAASARDIVTKTGSALSTALSAARDKFAAFKAEEDSAIDKSSKKRLDAVAAWKTKTTDALRADLATELAGIAKTESARLAGIATWKSRAEQAISDRLSRDLATIQRVHDADVTRIAGIQQRQSDANDKWLTESLVGIDKIKNSQLAAIDAQQAKLTPAEQQVADMQKAHDEAARQQAIQSAAQQLATDQAASASADQLAQDQRALDDANYQEQLAQTQAVADEERKQADLTAAHKRTLAENQAKAAAAGSQRAHDQDKKHIDATAKHDTKRADTAEGRNKKGAEDAAARAKRGVDASATAQEKTARERAKKAETAARAEEVAREKRIAASAKREEAAIREESDREKKLLDARIHTAESALGKLEKVDRSALDEVLKHHAKNVKDVAAVERKAFDDRIAALTKHVGASIGVLADGETNTMKVLDGYRVEWRSSGKALGEAFAKGIEDAKPDIAGAAAAAAGAAAPYLKLHSPAEKGPLSDLDHWWDGFGPTLVSSLKPGAITNAIAAGVGAQGSGAVRGLASRADSASVDQARRDALLLAAVERQTEILAGKDTAGDLAVHFHGMSPNDVALAATR